MSIDAPLAGTIDWQALSKLTHLITLKLPNNDLHGTLPQTLPGNLQSMYGYTLDVSNNQLTGTIPSTWTLPSKYQISLMYNNLIGEQTISWKGFCRKFEMRGEKASCWSVARRYPSIPWGARPSGLQLHQRGSSAGHLLIWHGEYQQPC